MSARLEALATVPAVAGAGLGAQPSPGDSVAAARDGRAQAHAEQPSRREPGSAAQARLQNSKEPRSPAAQELGQRVAREISALLGQGVSYLDSIALSKAIADSVLPGEQKAGLAGDLARSMSEAPVAAAAAGAGKAAGGRPPQSRIAGGPDVGPLDQAGVCFSVSRPQCGLGRGVEAACPARPCSHVAQILGQLGGAPVCERVAALAGPGLRLFADSRECRITAAPFPHASRRPDVCIHSQTWWPAEPAIRRSQDLATPAIAKVRLLAGRVATLGAASLAETTCRRAVAIVLLASQAADAQGDEALRLVRNFKAAFLSERQALSPKPPCQPLAAHPACPRGLPDALREYAWPAEQPIASKISRAHAEALVPLLPCRATHASVAQPVAQAVAARGPATPSPASARPLTTCRSGLPGRKQLPKRARSPGNVL